MFPHTITIYHHHIVTQTVTNNGTSTTQQTDAYSKTILHGVYIYTKTAQIGTGKGVELSESVNIVCSPTATKNYGKTWRCEVGDRIVNGVGGNITSWKNLTGDVYTIKQIEKNLAGTRIDNIVIMG